MKKKIFIHIGTHKTGTTTIQNTLEASRDVLKSHGILYPLTNREPWPNLSKHCSVFAAARSGDPAKQVLERDALVREFLDSGCDAMVVSEEGLSEPDDCYVDFFRELSSDFDLVTICYLRRQDYFIESMYNQFVRERARRESRPINQFWKAPAIRRRLNYHAILSRWKVISVNVIALNFDEEVKSHGLIKSFLMNIGASDVELTEVPSNRSPDMNAILALAKINAMGVDFGLHRILSAAHMLSEQYSYPSRKYLLGQKERLRLLAAMREENSRLEKDFGVHFDDSLPSNEGILPTTEVDLTYLLQLLALVSTKSH